jgi:nucleoside-diphosphate-sugar epimerase
MLFLVPAETWPNVPPAQAIVVTFPAVLPQTSKLIDFFRSRGDLPQLIVYGSTSRYSTREPDELVSEEYDVDKTQARVLGENFLQSHGATVLVLSGLVGPNREPKSWIQRGICPLQMIPNFLR